MTMPKLTQSDLDYACSNDVQIACSQAGALRLGDLVLRMASEILASRAIAPPRTPTNLPAASAEGWTLTDEQLAGMALWDRDVMLDERHRAVGAMLVGAAVREIRRLRAVEQRLLEWAEQLEGASPVGASIAAGLRGLLEVACPTHGGTACGWIDGECLTQEAPASIFDAAGRVNPGVFADPAEAAELQAELDVEAGLDARAHSRNVRRSSQTIDLDKLEQLSRAATPGPWKWHDSSSHCDGNCGSRCEVPASCISPQNSQWHIPMGFP